MADDNLTGGTYDYTAMGVGGLADLGLGIYNIVQGNKAAKQAKADLATAMANRPDLSPSTAFADAERQAYSKKMLKQWLPDQLKIIFLKSLKAILRVTKLKQSNSLKTY